MFLQMIGAFIYWAIFKFEGTYNDYLSVEYKSRNWNMGVFASIPLLLGVAALLDFLTYLFK